MKKYLWLIVILAVIGLVFVFAKNPKSSVEQSTIKIGVIAPLSGDYASIGEELKRGVDLAVGQLNASGKKIIVVYEDDKFDPKESVTAANKLINVDKVDFVGLFSLEEAKPVMPIFNDRKIPLVLFWDSTDFLKDAGPYIFSNGFSTERAGQTMADYAYNKLGLRKIAVVSHVDTWSEIIYKSFEEQFKKDGGQIVFSDAVQVGTSDFRVMISKIKSTNPDGIYFPLIPFDSVALLKQVKQLGLNIALLSGDALIQDVISEAGLAAENTYFTNVYSDNSELSALYKSKYGKESSGFAFVATGFDGIMKIGNSLNGTGDVKEILDKTFGPNRTTDRSEKIFVVKNGIPILVEK